MSGLRLSLSDRAPLPPQPITEIFAPSLHIGLSKVAEKRRKARSASIYANDLNSHWRRMTEKAARPRRNEGR
jgi:hypothetical protein